MKFALRDDDLNYFFSPEEIIKNYSGIWEICPVSMSVIPFVKGNWPKHVSEAEERGPGFINHEILANLKTDNTVHPIGENIPLIQFIKEKIKEKKIYLTIHAIHHRNEDAVTPQLSGNFGFGAEFYTTRDLSIPLKEAKKYLEHTFDQPIHVFTPPQNSYNSKGLDAIFKNNLAICGDLPSVKSFNTLKLFGLLNYSKYFAFKLFNRDIQFPFPIVNDKLKMIGHFRLQPGTDLKKLYADFEAVYKINGVFILSTHSYAFSYKMKCTTLTMGEALSAFVSFAESKKNIEFVNLNQIFK